MIENTFGVMTARFRVLRHPIHAKVETIENITKACVGLHNYLMSGQSFERESYCPPGFTEDNGTGGGWRELTSGDTGFLRFFSEVDFRREWSCSLQRGFYYQSSL